ncbi:MAG: hypothetical protein M1294_06750 [Firmicutes bacterium]|jgi:hypothetical protein|nr:hypothetical protein [Bacillota bacterium]MCL5014969.1 hypothetical protein [Bacillota bacterium]
MKRWEWFVSGAMGLSVVLTGCGSAISTAQTPSHISAQTRSHSNVSLGHTPVHIAVRQKRGQLTVQISAPKGVSAPEVAKLQSAVHQLNGLLHQLQNP